MAKNSQLVFFTILALTSSALAAEECCEAPCIDVCSGEFFATASFLYWNAGMNNLYYAITNTTDMSDMNTPKDIFSTGDLRRPGFSWDPGVQASIGWRECDCGWIFSLTGTYYKTHSKDQIRGPIPDFSGDILEFVSPLINPSFSGNFVSSETEEGVASAEWKLTFGMIDALVGGRFTPWRCFSLMPNFGLRTVWINHSLDLLYSPITFLVLSGGSNLISITEDKSVSNLKNTYWGIGFKGGLDFEAQFCSNFSLIGGFGMSLLYGTLKEKDDLSGHTVDPGAQTILNNVTSSFSEKIEKMASNLETELGLAYTFNCGCVAFDLSASYMFSIFFDQCEFRNFVFTPPSVTSPQVLLNFQTPLKIYSNLLMQGVNVQLGISF